MTYKETLQYLYTAAPLFQQKGAVAYKPGLQTTHLLDIHFKHPHQKFKSIHIGGTNGKGSTAHTLAAILQSSGLKVGLYTSPHLLDFRERIRINGEMISEEYVIKFIEQEKSFFEPISPSFFELTTAMAFKYFAEQKVDIAIIEVGLGGRLDCTNIITPLLSIITNISLDHTQYLGHCIKDIAIEKAGIIKSNIPVLIGEYTPESKEIFKQKALNTNSPIIFAEDCSEIISTTQSDTHKIIYNTHTFGIIESELSGIYQIKNTNTILHAIKILRKNNSIERISDEAVRIGFANVCTLTNLKGRWQTIQTNPLVICDTGHNVGGWYYLKQNLLQMVKNNNTLHIVFGVANDKDITHILELLPQNAKYYWTKASVDRALDEKELEKQAILKGLSGETHPTVISAYNSAYLNAKKNDIIFIGGSNFVVADFFQAKSVIK